MFCCCTRCMLVSGDIALRLTLGESPLSDFTGRTKATPE